MLIYKMLYSFRMPLFVFVSGFLMLFTTRMVHKKKTSLSQFFTVKVKRLLLPFFVLTLVTFIPRAMMSDIADDTISPTFESLVQSVLYGDKMVIPYFWFLQASFILLITTYAFITVCEIPNIHNALIYIMLIGGATCIMIFLPENITTILSLDRAAELGIFFVCGIVYCRYSTYIDRYIIWTSVCFFAFISAAWAILYFVTENTAFVPICSLAGIAMCISLAKILESRKITVLDHLIGANYIIFLLSWYCNVASQQILHHYVQLPWWVYTILSLTSGIYIPWLAYKYLQSHRDSRWVRVTTFLLGQRLG